MKRCRRCGESKALSLFATRSAAKDGKSSWCKACHTAHYHLNAEKRSADRLRWKAENPDYFRSYYASNRERRIAEAMAWNSASGGVHQRRHMYGLIAQRVEQVDRHEVYRRAGGSCGICSEPVDPANFHVDHIIPLARGGVHSYANTQPAHPLCNHRKGARAAA